MKPLFLLSIMSFFLLNCNETKKEESTEQTQITETTDDVTETSNPFIGTWSRSFAMSDSVNAKVTYTFMEDSLQYEMNGPMNLKYSIKKDSLSLKTNRWVGNKKGQTYVIFIKDASKESVTLLKMKAENIENALEMPFPSDTARSKFSSWNTYSHE